MSVALPNVTIRGESIQALYATYLRGGFLVNRRYQRKLVWTIEEKRRFVDSLRKSYPVPVFLLTEAATNAGVVYEIIDGMQRLNAIFSFLEGDVAVDSQYFDLSTIPETKQRLDNGVIKQKEPKLPLDDCRSVVTYQLPLSVSRNKTSEEIDEIFRRINSYGRHLSRQELRQAGATGAFPELVRKLAARVRGDVSASDRLDLSRMKEISITNTKLDYGITVESLFWVANKILRPEQVRESRDEELIADIIAYNVLSPKPGSSTAVFDEYYGITRTAEQAERAEQIEVAIKKHGELALISRYMAVHDEIRELIAVAGKPFNLLMFEDAGPRVPRYFQVVFSAMYQQMVNENMMVSDRKKLVKALDGIGAKFNVSEGGTWSADNRQSNVDAVVGMIRRAFKKKGKVDAALDSWATELENILMQSKTENNLVEMKQGMHAILPPFAVEQGVPKKVAKTLAAMANAGSDVIGYVIFGVTDEAATASTLIKSRKLKTEEFNGFHILGIDHEAKDTSLYKKGLDSYFQQLLQGIKATTMSQTHRDQVLRDARVVSYFGKHLIVLTVRGQSTPCAFDSEFFERHGSHCSKVEGEALIPFMKRFV